MCLCFFDRDHPLSGVSPKTTLMLSLTSVDSRLPLLQDVDRVHVPPAAASLLHDSLVAFIWGFGYHFTNYDFILQNKNLEFVLNLIFWQRGEIQGLCLIFNVMFESIVGEIVAKFPCKDR